jgi:predicted transcriptional regulator of viral defense system
MKHYEELIKLGCFSRKTIVKTLGSKAAASSLIHDYLKKGYIERVRHDFYAVISLETKQPVLSRYQIGSRLFPDAYLSHHSAFEVYGYANQVFNQVTVATKSRFSDFVYDGVLYHRIAPASNAKTIFEGEVRLTSIEQTVVDSINDLEKQGGLEETLRCLLLVPSLNSEKILEALNQYHKGFLYQKTGFLLESMNPALSLPDSFFKECSRHVPLSKRYLTKDTKDLVYYRRWRLYAPKSIQSLVNKGVKANDSI